MASSVWLDDVPPSRGGGDPVAPDGRIWLAKMSRVPTCTVSWEVPGGAIDEGEDALVAGLREMEEECALVAEEGGKLLPTVFELAPGMGTFSHRFVIARGVVPKGRRAVPQRDAGDLERQSFRRAAGARDDPLRQNLGPGDPDRARGLGFPDAPEERAGENAVADDARASPSRRSRVYR